MISENAPQNSRIMAGGITASPDLIRLHPTTSSSSEDEWNPIYEEEATPARQAVQTVVAAPRPVVKATSQPVPAASKPSPAPAHDDSAGIDECLAARTRTQRRRRLTANAMILAVLVAVAWGAYAYVWSDPARKAKVLDVVAQFKKDKSKEPGMIDSYKQALGQVGERGNQIDAAARSLGADPTKVRSSDADFDKDMQKMMGGDGVTVAARNQLLREKLGGAATVLGAVAGSPDPKAAPPAGTDKPSASPH